MSQYGWNDCPAGVRRQIEKMCEGFRRRLAENLIGIYLHGSLATGCFNPLGSDLDLLVIARESIGLEAKRSLARFLLDASLNPRPVEISFLRLDDLHPWRHPTRFELHYSEDWREKFERELKTGDWKQWNDKLRFDDDLAAHVTVLNHRGIQLYGQPIADVFPSVPKKDFVRSILGDVLSEKFGLDAVLEYPVYVVLNACRTLAFLRAGSVLSKKEGGRWALQNLPAEFGRIICGALDEYSDSPNESRLPEEQLVGFAVYMKNEIERQMRSNDWS